MRCRRSHAHSCCLSHFGLAQYLLLLRCAVTPAPEGSCVFLHDVVILISSTLLLLLILFAQRSIFHDGSKTFGPQLCLARMVPWLSALTVSLYCIAGRLPLSFYFWFDGELRCYVGIVIGFHAHFPTVSP